MESLGEILGKIGFDWQVALANLVNFLIIFFLLRQFAFKPIQRVLKARQDKINLGLEKAKEADVRLKEIDQIAKSKIKEADMKALAIIDNTEKKAKELEKSFQEKVEQQQKQLAQKIQAEYNLLKDQAREEAAREASDLVKKFIVKAVELRPSDIDEALVSKAVLQAKNEN